MKPIERGRISRIIINTFTECNQYGRIISFGRPSNIVRGIYIEDCSDPEYVYLWAFVQPLYVPSTTVVLNLGRRVGGGSHVWSVADVERTPDKIVADAVGYLGDISTPDHLIKWIHSHNKESEYAKEVEALSMIAAGHYSEGIIALTRFAESLPPGGPRWLSEIRMRAIDLARTAGNDTAAAEQRLQTWERETKRHLRIPT